MGKKTTYIAFKSIVLQQTSDAEKYTEHKRENDIML